MNKHSIMAALATAIFSFLLASCASQPSKNYDSIVSQMTLDEKVHTLVGTHDATIYEPAPAPECHRTAPVYTQDKILGNTAYSDKRVPGAAGDGYAVERLGIPSVVYADGPAGLRISAQCTAFPTSTLLASTFDEKLVEKVGAAIGNEVLEFGADILLAPGMNIQRNPLCGRNFEYFSEDPFLCGKSAAAYVRGVQSNGVGTSIKHFAFNNQEFYRNGIDVVADARTLREIYLRGFEIAVREAKPWTVMSSYNRVGGHFTSECGWLLDDILRGEWGFDGFVMTDWWGADDPVEQMKARNNLLMPGSPMQVAEIKDAVAEGRLDEAVLDRNVKDMLSVIDRCPIARGYAYSDAPDFDAHAAVARSAAADGMVLLENNGALPVAPCSAALFGCYSYDTQPGGSGSGFVTKRYKVTIAQGLEDAGFVIDQPLSSSYQAHIAAYKADKGPEGPWNVPIAPEISLSERTISAAASRNDIAIFTIGRMAGEDGDRKPVAGDYYLSTVEREMLTRVCCCFHAVGKKVICLVNAGAAIAMDGWQGAAAGTGVPDAVLYVWMPGQEGGHAVADVVSGRVCPSGKLPATFAARYEDYPTAANFGLSSGEINRVRYEEGLMVGYRSEALLDAAVYPFGYGLSYTSFEYSELAKGKTLKDGSIAFTVRVTNTGSVAGREAVQLYVSKPALDGSCACVRTEGRPAKELCAFAKTGVLKPGQSEVVKLVVPAYELLQFVNADELPCDVASGSSACAKPAILAAGSPAAGAWQLAPGTYTFAALSNSASAPAEGCVVYLEL